MNRLVPGEVTIAIVAPPANPVGETGGAEVFTGSLANALAEQGFPVRVYGQENPSFEFVDGVTYVETSPTTNNIMARDRIGIRKAINETGVAAPLRLAMDIGRTAENQQWAVIDNDTTSVPLVPLISRSIPCLFVQHSHMTPHAYSIYDKVRTSGGKIIAIADHQREKVAAEFGSLHDITIKNGISTQDFSEVSPAIYRPGEPIRVGTLSRIESSDIKGVKLTVRAVQKLRERHAAQLTIVGPLSDQVAYNTVVAPFLDEYTLYDGPKRAEEKASYIANLHVGAALSNPGGWNSEEQTFTSWFAEGNSLTLHEMIYGGTIPVSTDSGGAEPMKDTGLHDYIVPLDTIRHQGMDAFIALAAQKMLCAAYAGVELSSLRSKVRTTEDMGRDYGEYILSLLTHSS